MDDIVLELLSLLETALGSEYKKYYYGSSPIPVQAYMPFLEVDPTGTEVENKGTGGCKDNVFQITIRIKDDLKHYLKANTNNEIAEYKQKLVKRMEERNTDGTFKSDTVMGVLTENLKLGGKANIISDFVISYDDILPLDESYIIIGSVTFNVNLITPN